MYICIYVSMYVCIYVYMCTYANSLQVNSHDVIFASSVTASADAAGFDATDRNLKHNVCACIHMYLHMCMHVCMHLYICIYICTCRLRQIARERESQFEIINRVCRAQRRIELFKGFLCSAAKVRCLKTEFTIAGMKGCC